MRDEKDAKLLARAVEGAIWQCLQNAMNHPEREDYWRRQADLLERKFTTECGCHYSYFL